MRYFRHAIIITLIMISLMTASGCGQSNPAYPAPSGYPYPYLNP